MTLSGSRVVEELVQGRILIAKERATELAGRCCAALDHLMLDPEAELLAHQRGWMWAVYYTQGKARTHFALIQSDGTPLARALVDEVMAADQICGGTLQQLSCLNPAPPPGTDTDPRVADALAAYRQHLTNECGFIQLDGLPADSDVGSRRLKLEALFVPLHLDVTVRMGSGAQTMERNAAGAVLAEHPRLALLAAPGGGKSTLIKRLAVAYADTARRRQIADDLPSRDWLPLFFRCRELRGLARGSFAELLDALSQRELVRQHGPTFRACVERALLAGRILLLVDGLDEISDPGDRAAFVCTLRSALLAYPEIGIVVTSREAGFRHVAAHLAPVCTHATLSPLDEDDIRRLSVAWHREVVGDTEKVQADAEQLAALIVRNDRIKRLAVNPLLLTTLLLVKRWVGSLPTRRAILYGKAVEVLLMTWNTEAHEPIPEEEALPQLGYVASAIMLEGVQKVSRPRLAALLQEARDALPIELGYVKGSVDDFIHRIEDRSSLLMMRLGSLRVWLPPAEPDVLGRLLKLSRCSPDGEIRRFAAWALGSQPLASRDEAGRFTSCPRSEVEELFQRFDELGRTFEKPAALVVAWYLHVLNDAELARRISKSIANSHPTADRTLRELLERLGERP